MKKLNGFSVVGVIIGVIALALIVLAGYVVIDGNNKATKFEDYDFYSVIEPTKDNGDIGDHVKGDKDAPVLIFEYADYQCSACASYNPRVNQLVEELDGKVAVVYRSFLLSYQQKRQVYKVIGKNMAINYLRSKRNGSMLRLQREQNYLISISKK